MAKILLIDDTETDRKLITLHLEKKGNTVVTYTSFKEGYANIPQENPDVILLDVLMPDTDGIEGIQIIKKNFKEIPLIIVSADEFYLSIVSSLGADSTWFKHYRKIDSLHEKIDDLLNKQTN